MVLTMSNLALLGGRTWRKPENYVTIKIGSQNNAEVAVQEVVLCRHLERDTVGELHRETRIHRLFGLGERDARVAPEIVAVRERAVGAHRALKT